MCPQLPKNLPGRGRAGGARAALPLGGWAQPTSPRRPKVWGAVGHAKAAGRPGESRGGTPSGKGFGGCAPSSQKTSEGGWVGKTNVAMPIKLGGRWGMLKRRCRCHLPLPPHPLHPLPYPHAHRPQALSSFEGPIPRRSPAAARCGCRACPAPCFPLSVSGHSSPGPSAPIRPAPWQLRLVPLCRRFPRPPAGPSAPRPASAWQLRLVSLCRLVRRASNPSCTASLQAGPAGKNAQHNSKQVKPPFDQGIGGECYRASPRKGPMPCGS